MPQFVEGERLNFSGFARRLHQTLGAILFQSLATSGNMKSLQRLIAHVCTPAYTAGKVRCTILETILRGRLDSSSVVIRMETAFSTTRRKKKMSPLGVDWATGPKIGSNG